jgi:hypothetical protein
MKLQHKNHQQCQSQNIKGLELEYLLKNWIQANKWA